MSAEAVFVLSDSLRRGVLRAVGSNDAAVGTAATAMAERLMRSGAHAESAHVALLGRRWRSASHAMRCAVARGEISFTRLFTDELESVSYRDALSDPFLAVVVAVSAHGRMIHSARDELLAMGINAAESLGEDDNVELTSATSQEAEVERSLWKAVMPLIATRALGDWSGLADATRYAIAAVRRAPKPALAGVGALRSFIAAEIELALALCGSPEYAPVQRHVRLATALSADDVAWVLGSVALAAAMRGDISAAKAALGDIDEAHVAGGRRPHLPAEHLTASAIIALEDRDGDALRLALDAMTEARMADSGLTDMQSMLETRHAYLIDRGTRSFDTARPMAHRKGLPWVDAETAAFRIERYLSEGQIARAHAALDEAQRSPHAKWNLLRLSLAKSRFAQNQIEAALKIAESVWTSDAATPRLHARALAIGSACARRLGDSAYADRLRSEVRLACERSGLQEPYDDLSDVAVVGTARIRPPMPVPMERLELTRRQLAVLRALSELAGADEIAASMHVSKNTVKTQLRHIYRKLGVHSRDEALRAATDGGLL